MRIHRQSCCLVSSPAHDQTTVCERSRSHDAEAVSENLGQRPRHRREKPRPATKSVRTRLFAVNQHRTGTRSSAGHHLNSKSRSSVLCSMRHQSEISRRNTCHHLKGDWKLSRTCLNGMLPHHPTSRGKFDRYYGANAPRRAVAHDAGGFDLNEPFMVGRTARRRNTTCSISSSRS
jgi:hypothetical protein